MRASPDPMRTLSVLRLATVVLVLLGLFGCADKPPAPIEDRSGPGTARSDQRYTVLRGDTLYAIAFRYGLDYRRLAAANNISAPYTIFPGQRLQLREARVPATTPAASTTRSPASPKPATSTASTSSKNGAERSAARVAKSETSASAPSNKTPAKPSSSVSSSTSPSSDAGWLWPAGGRLTRRFDENLNKGIDIGGERGDAVRATRSGRVVYAGSGIAGYGLMLILRHSDDYLSAYGHNDALLVEEGDTVRAGQPVARKGSSGTDTVKLHFEIRRRGRPVDPLRLLPPR